MKNIKKLIIKIFIMIGVLAILFYPFFNGVSIWNYLEGPKVSIEAVYPPDGTLIQMNYKNVGGKPLNNIEIRYSFGWDPDIFPTGSIKASTPANLTSRYLEPHESGNFFINMTTLPGCTLAKEYPTIQLYQDEKSNCYYKWISKLPDDVCVPALINISFSSKEVIPAKLFNIYYPVAYSSIYLKMCQKIENEECINPCNPYDSVTNLTLFPIGDPGKLEDQFTNTIIENFEKFSKKYCNEGLMPVDWCVENNLN